MKKRILAFLLVATMALTMCSCDDVKKETARDKKNDDVETEKVEEAKEVAEAKPHTTNYSESEITEKVTVVVDGKEVTPTDNNGEAVETIIHDGVVYLPVKTVADATGKAYYWDGPEYTVYIGDMDGGLGYPTVELENMVSINQGIHKSERLVDNYGNRYGRAINNGSGNYQFEYILNMKYSKFKGTLYIPEGEKAENSVYLKITADGKTIYTSPEMTRASAPIDVDVDVTGYNDVKIEFSGNAYYDQVHQNYLQCNLGDAGFYQ